MILAKRRTTQTLVSTFVGSLSHPQVVGEREREREREVHGRHNTSCLHPTHPKVICSRACYIQLSNHKWTIPSLGSLQVSLNFVSFAVVSVWTILHFLGEIRSWNLQWLEKEGKNTIKIVSHHHSYLQRKTKF
jgi:hypothetical protein